MFLGERFLVTRSSAHSVSTETLRAGLVSGEIPPDTPPAALALRLCRAIADRFMPLLMSVEDRLEEMEAEMLERPSDDLLAELLRQSGDLKRMLRILQYHLQVFSAARAHTPVQFKGYHHELTDVQEQLDRHLSLTRLYYELTDDLMDGYLSLSAHRLNQIMQTLTIVTVVFVPELKFRGAYFLLLGAMLTVVTGILVFFFRRGWLGGRARPR